VSEIPTREDFIYAAGIVDGEGNICISKCTRPRMKSPSYSTHTHVYNTNPTLIRYLKSTFGGADSFYDSGNPKHKPEVGWHLYGEESRKFLLNILPFLKLKNEQAKLAIAFQEEMNKNGTRGRVTPDSATVREELYQKCALLNKRGRKKL